MALPKPFESLSALPDLERRKEPPRTTPTDPLNARDPSQGGGRGGAQRAPGQRGHSAGAPEGPRGAAVPQRGEVPGRARAHPPSVCRRRAPRPRRRSRPSRSSALTWSRLHRARTRPCPSPAEKAPPPLPQPGRATAGRRLATAEAPAPRQLHQSERRGAGERHEK